MKKYLILIFQVSKFGKTIKEMQSRIEANEEELEAERQARYKIFNELFFQLEYFFLNFRSKAEGQKSSLARELDDLAER